MTATHDLHQLGQSLWIDNITRPMLDSGTLARYIAELDVTGLTSNPTIYDKAIGGSDAYDDEVRRSVEAWNEGRWAPTPPGGPGHASAGGGAVRSAPALATTTNAIAATSRAARP